MNRKLNFPKVLSKNVVSLIVGVSTVLGAGLVHAGTDTSSLEVSATVTANCTITTAPVAFGAYDPVVTNASTALDATGTVTTTCTNGASATILLGQGANADTGSTDAAPVRRMISGSDYLSYQLYSDSGRSTVWGNDATSDVATTGTGSNVDVTVYGSVTAGQNVPSGSYADTVVATVSF